MNTHYRLTRVLLAIMAPVIVLLILDAFVSVVKATGVVTVSATVATSITCTSSTSTVALGALTSGAIASTTGLGNASTSLSCNTGLGCTLTVADAGNASNPGLATTSPAYLIGSSNASFAVSTTLVAGTEGYGIKAVTSTEGSGGGLITLNSRYASTSYATVGGLTLAGVTLVSTTAQTTSRSVVVSHWAAIAATTQAGIYGDTITYSCTGN